MHILYILCAQIRIPNFEIVKYCELLLFYSEGAYAGSDDCTRAAIRSVIGE